MIDLGQAVGISTTMLFNYLHFHLGHYFHELDRELQRDTADRQQSFMIFFFRKRVSTLRDMLATDYRTEQLMQLTLGYSLSGLCSEHSGSLICEA